MGKKLLQEKLIPHYENCINLITSVKMITHFRVLSFAEKIILWREKSFTCYNLKNSTHLTLEMFPSTFHGHIERSMFTERTVGPDRFTWQAPMLMSNLLMYKMQSCLCWGILLVQVPLLTSCTMRCKLSQRAEAVKCQPLG